MLIELRSRLTASGILLLTAPNGCGPFERVRSAAGFRIVDFEPRTFIAGSFPAIFLHLFYRWQEYRLLQYQT